MHRPPVSLARLMVVVAIVAVDCGLVRFLLSAGDELGALCAVGLAESPVLILILLTRGRLSRFASGFVVTALLWAITVIVLVSGLHPKLGELWNTCFNFMLRWTPLPLADDSNWQPVDAFGSTRPGLTLTGAMFCQAVVGVPMFILALAGGLLTRALGVVRVRPWHPARPRHEPS